MKEYIEKCGAILAVIALTVAVAAPQAVSAADYQSYQWSPGMTTYGGASYGSPYQYQLGAPYQYQAGSPYQYQFQNEVQYRQYLLSIIAQLQQILAAYITDRDDDKDRGNSEIEITTRSATNIKDREARLNGEIDFNSSRHAYVWFEYGEDDDDLDDDTPHIRLDDDDDEDFSIRLTDLDRNQRYYFKAAGEDEDGIKDYGSIRNFRTGDDDDNDREEEPDVETGDAEDVTDDSAELNGEVDMNDFRNGIVFFVYGEDEDQVDDVERDYDSYRDVDEDGDDLQKVRVDSDLDGRAEYRLDIDGLDDDTEYFFAICVEYEDEDDDETLKCGSTEEFETDD